MPLSIDEFCERVGASKVLSAEVARAALSSVAENERPTDGESLAALLVKSGKLTAFQAKRICEGKGVSLLLGNYVLLNHIGRGGMGDVFKAEHRRMKRVVALKVVKSELLDSPGALKRFQREVETVAKLDHPNVVTAHDADEANGIHFLVMQFVEGRDLSSVVKAMGCFSISQAVDCVLQAARGLAYAHEQGIVHRDVKPGNMLLDRKGTVKILDLGLATLTAKDANANDSLTGSEMIVGTLDYMAPEQAQSPKLADERSDIYSLGMTLWYLLTGRAAYEAETVVAKLLAHQQQPIPSLVGQASGLPGSPEVKDLDAIFQRTAAKRPADRYQSMGEVVAVLEVFQRDHRPGSTDATVQLSSGSGGGNLTQRRGGAEGKQAAEVAEALLGEPAVAPKTGERTESILSSLEDTTANRKKPVSGMPVVVSATKRRGRRVSWRQYSLLAIAAAAFLVAAIGSPLLMLKLSTPTGSIVVTTDQPEIEGAHVSLDGQTKFRIGRSGPQKAIRLAADDQHHTLFVTRDGFQPYSRQIRISDSTSQRVFVHLSPVAKSSVTPAPAQTGKSVSSASPSPHPPTPSPSSGGFALEFNGTDSYVEIPSLRYEGDHPLTVEVHVTPGQNPAPQAIVHVRGSKGFLALSRNGDNWYAYARTGDREFVTDVAGVQPGRRSHLAAVWDETRLRLFVDGNLNPKPAQPTERRSHGGSSMIGAVGTPEESAAKPWCLSGRMDEVRMSDVERYTTDFAPATRFETDANTLALYHFDEGAGEVLTDSSGNNHDGKIVNARWVPGIAGGPEY